MGATCVRLSGTGPWVPVGIRVALVCWTALASSRYHTPSVGVPEVWCLTGWLLVRPDAARPFEVRLTGQRAICNDLGGIDSIYIPIVPDGRSLHYDPVGLPSMVGPVEPRAGMISESCLGEGEARGSGSRRDWERNPEGRERRDRVEGEHENRSTSPGYTSNSNHSPNPPPKHAHGHIEQHSSPPPCLPKGPTLQPIKSACSCQIACMQPGFLLAAAEPRAEPALGLGGLLLDGAVEPLDGVVQVLADLLGELVGLLLRLRDRAPDLVVELLVRLARLLDLRRARVSDGLAMGGWEGGGVGVPRTAWSTFWPTSAARRLTAALASSDLPDVILAMSPVGGQLAGLSGTGGGGVGVLTLGLPLRDLGAAASPVQVVAYTTSGGQADREEDVVAATALGHFVCVWCGGWWCWWCWWCGGCLDGSREMDVETVVRWEMEEAARGFRTGAWQRPGLVTTARAHAQWLRGASPQAPAQAQAQHAEPRRASHRLHLCFSSFL